MRDMTCNGEPMGSVVTRSKTRDLISNHSNKNQIDTLHHNIQTSDKQYKSWRVAVRTKQYIIIIRPTIIISISC